MGLTGSARQQLHTALLDAFPNKSALAQLVGFELSEDLDAIAGDGARSAVVFNLITWAESRGREDELLSGALAQNPDNLLLRELADQGQSSAFSVTAREVFISYAWSGESGTIAKQLDQSFQTQGIDIIRDQKDAGYKADIKDFMKQIGQGKCVLVVISDKYLKSENCMFELVEIANSGDFYDRIFPIVLSDANIYKAAARLEYKRYWEQQRNELETKIKAGGLTNLQGITDDLDLYDEICRRIPELTDILKNMNTLTPDMHRDSDFGDVIEAVKAKLAE